MPARIPELIIAVASLIALVLAIFVVPRIERKEKAGREERVWAIIDHEFIEFGIGEAAND